MSNGPVFVPESSIQPSAVRQSEFSSVAQELRACRLCRESSAYMLSGTVTLWFYNCTFRPTFILSSPLFLGTSTTPHRTRLSFARHMAAEGLLKLAQPP